jgi:2-haloacid dehalogenase
MTGRTRPEVVVFDVVETLACLQPVSARLTEVGQDDSVLPRWFTRLLRDGIALTAAGGYGAFTDVAASALRAETRGELNGEQVTQVVAGFRELTPQPDAAAGVRAAVAAGLRVFTLSNGAADPARGFLERAGIADLVEQVLSVDEVRAWKPARAPYDLAVRRAGVPVARVALVAVHSWDIHGAHAAGLTTGWCPRLEHLPTPVFQPADVIANTLDGVITGLAALPGSRNDDQ